MPLLIPKRKKSRLKCALTVRFAMFNCAAISELSQPCSSNSVICRSRGPSRTDFSLIQLPNEIFSVSDAQLNLYSVTPSPCSREEPSLIGCTKPRALTVPPQTISSAISNSGQSCAPYLCDLRRGCGYWWQVASNPRVQAGLSPTKHDTNRTGFAGCFGGMSRRPTRHTGPAPFSASSSSFRSPAGISAVTVSTRQRLVSPGCGFMSNFLNYLLPLRIIYTCIAAAKNSGSVL